MLGKLRNRTSQGMTRRLRRLIRRAPGAFKTLTADNSSPRRTMRGNGGATRTLNGLLRQYLPKRTSLASVTQGQCDVIAHLLNTRPRKRLGYRTPAECFHS